MSSSRFLIDMGHIWDMEDFCEMAPMVLSNTLHFQNSHRTRRVIRIPSHTLWGHRQSATLREQGVFKEHTVQLKDQLFKTCPLLLAAWIKYRNFTKNECLRLRTEWNNCLIYPKSVIGAIEFSKVHLISMYMEDCRECIKCSFIIRQKRFDSLAVARKNSETKRHN